MKVTTILVSHNGARWLPAVLGGLQSQTRPSDQVVVVDTGSTDDSVARIQAANHEVIQAGGAINFSQAVALALESLPAATPQEWIWLLQDDSNPDPDCLQHLSAAAQEAGPEYAAIGPKIREWPSLRRLLEVGVTITGTGQRETQLLPGEYDQGQHDNIHPSLAANTAGLLIRRTALEALPLDPNLGAFFADIDLGWRLAKAGLATVIEPRAIIFHAEAARRGLRDARSTRHPRAIAREAATYTVLTNSPTWTLPFKWLRLLFGGLLRVLGLLLVRAVDDAIDEALGLLRGLGRINRIRYGRKQRRAEARAHPREPLPLRSLMAPWWLPYAHGGDFISDVWMGLLDSARAAIANDTQERPFWKRMVLNPSSWGLLVATVLAVVLNFGWLAATSLHGGALLGAPEDFTHWWSLWANGWHWLGNGTTEPAAAYVVLLGLASLLTLGSPDLLVTLVFALAVPLSMVGAIAFAHRLLTSKWSRLFLAVSYALLPVVSGAVAQGRLGTVVALIVLPWPALSALRLASPEREVRIRASWRTALGAALVVMFVPLAWVFLVFLLALSPWLTGHRLRLRVWLPILIVPLAFSLPWLAQTVTTPGLWLFEAGRIGAVDFEFGPLDLLAGRAGGPGAAWVWFGWLLPLLALLALTRSATRRSVVRAWLVVAAAAPIALLSLLVVSLPGVSVTARPWIGFSVVLVQVGWMLAVALASQGLLAVALEVGVVKRTGIVVAALMLLIGPLFGVLWWTTNAHEGPVGTKDFQALPRYMQDLASKSDRNATLVLSGGRQGSPVMVQLLRRGEMTLGDDSVLAATPIDQQLAQKVADLLVNPDDQFAQTLQERGITYVYAPRPVSDAVSGAVDAAPGLVSASQPRAGTRAWQVTDSGTQGPQAQRNWWHPALLGAQVLAMVVVLVAVMPSNLSRRRVG